MDHTKHTANTASTPASAQIGENFASSVYGPVHSWRAGWSLGIDLLLNTSTCSFNCIYCQLGEIQLKTAERQCYVPTAKVQADFLAVDWQKADIITFSGNGEPTLATNLGEVMRWIATQTQSQTQSQTVNRAKIMVLTNGTLLNDPDVQQDLCAADIVAIKLDAATEAGLKQMNRPVAGISVDNILTGILAFKRVYKAQNPQGKLALQCMFMPTNFALSRQDEARAMADLIAKIAPDEVQLNTPKRLYPLEWTVDNRGNHDGEVPVATQVLRTVDEAEAHAIEQLIREASPGVAIRSIYS
ncbi:MAG: radical SAM protein [Vampirovibrionales bacterium]|nr:radical SAM protein [Vampirovibrionales bacterium]